MKDNFPAASAGSAARNFEAIVPSDTVDLPNRYKAIYVNTAGDVAMVGDSDTGNVGVIHTVLAGAVLLGSPRRILDTGTTAGLVGWF